VISPAERPLSVNTQHPHQTDMHASAGFKPAIPANERSQTHALDRAVAGAGLHHYRALKLYLHCKMTSHFELQPLKLHYPSKNFWFSVVPDGGLFRSKHAPTKICIWHSEGRASWYILI